MANGKWIDVHNVLKSFNKEHFLILSSQYLPRGAFCQFLSRWIYYCHSRKSTGKKTGETHLYAVIGGFYFESLTLFFDLTSFYRLGQNGRNTKILSFVFLVQMKTLKFAFEVY